MREERERERKEKREEKKRDIRVNYYYNQIKLQSLCINIKLWPFSDSKTLFMTIYNSRQKI